MNTLRRTTPDKFSQTLIISVSLHLALFIGFTAKSLFFQSEPLVFQDAIKVEIIDLPEKLRPRPPVKKKKPEKKAEKKPEKKKVNLKTAKSKQLAALGHLKTQSALAKLKNQKKSKPEKKQPEQPKYKGNILSDGTALKGLSKLQHNQYLGLVRRHIYENWYLPEWLAKSQLNAQVLIKIDQFGKIKEQKLINASNNKAFDQLVLSTVEKSDPLPRPPEKFTRIFAVDGITLGFPE